MAAGGNDIKGKICKCSRETCVENLMATETEEKKKKIMKKIVIPGRKKE